MIAGQVVYNPEFGWYHIIVLTLMIVCVLIPFIVLHLPWGPFDGANLHKSEVKAQTEELSEEESAAIILGGTVSEIRHRTQETARIYDFPIIDRQSLTEGAIASLGSQPLPHPVRTFRLDFVKGQGTQISEVSETSDDTRGGKTT